VEEYFNQLLKILADSIEAIEENYFSFSVAGKDETIERERIYCGELYHQMRNRFDVIDYEVNNEPNKIKHPFIENQCGAVDPDFIVHRPGLMGEEDNLAVIEVKRSTGNLTTGILKDITTINCMTTIENGYYGGIILIYGNLNGRRRRSLVKRIIEHKSDEVGKLFLLLHQSPGVKPKIIEL